VTDRQMERERESESESESERERERERERGGKERDVPLAREPLSRTDDALSRAKANLSDGNT
jgi:hypothetical protein